MASLPRLHLVTDDRVVAGERFLGTAVALLEAAPGGIVFHLRAPATAGGRLFALASALVARAHACGSILLVNDRIDVALASRADGVQLGARSLRLSDARRLLGPNALIGVSVHAAEEGRAALAGGADFVMAGTLFASVSHPGRPGTGVAWMGELSRGGRAIGIGGVTPARVAQVLDAGAHGVAVIGAIWDAVRPVEALRRFTEALEEREGID